MNREDLENYIPLKKLREHLQNCLIDIEGEINIKALQYGNVATKGISRPTEQMALVQIAEKEDYLRQITEIDIQLQEIRDYIDRCPHPVLRTYMMLRYQVGHSSVSAAMRMGKSESTLLNNLAAYLKLNI